MPRKQQTNLSPKDVAPHAFKWNRNELEEMIAVSTCVRYTDSMIYKAFSVQSVPHLFEKCYESDYRSDAGIVRPAPATNRGHLSRRQPAWEARRWLH